MSPSKINALIGIIKAALITRTKNDKNTGILYMVTSHIGVKTKETMSSTKITLSKAKTRTLVTFLLTSKP